MYIICIKGLISISDAKFYLIISTVKYIIASKNKIQVVSLYSQRLKNLLILTQVIIALF